MASGYYSENEAHISNQPLPTPSGTPYSSRSRMTPRYGTPVSESSTSPPPFPPDSKETHNTNDRVDDLSMLDPRRITPTLHASLVSEILALRRDLDSKNNFIEDLETSLHQARDENDKLTNKASLAAREGRAVKGQLQQLESATLSALEEVTNERDRLKETNTDLKEKLHSTQKKLRTQEDDSTRVHDMWAQEKETWAGEKVSLERRMHISENRLKSLLEEIAAHEEAQENGPGSEFGDGPRDNGVGPESDGESVQSSPARRMASRLIRHSRSMSNSSFRSCGRDHRMSPIGHAISNGRSLADELTFDEEDEELDELELDSDDYTEHELRALRVFESRQSTRQDDKAKRILGLTSESDISSRDILSNTQSNEFTRPSFGWPHSSVAAPQDVTLVFPPPLPQPPQPVETPGLEYGAQHKPTPKPQYVDTGVQPSPPSSPVRHRASDAAPAPKLYDVASLGAEVEANQRRKRVSAWSNSSAEPSNYPSMPQLMTSASSQTNDDPLSPPATPKVEMSFVDASFPTDYQPARASIATQTEPIPSTDSNEPVQDVLVESSMPEQPQLIVTSPPPPKRAPPPVPISVPSIAIHAPSSAPSSPRQPVLPPGTKNAITQTTPDLRSNMRTVGMQTEPIIIDKRFSKLPPHLQPSSINSNPGTPNSSEAKKADITIPVPSTRRDIKALLDSVAKEVEDRYPGNNDNGPLVRDRKSSISRPFRTSSLFAGFDKPSSDEEASDADDSGDEQHRPQYTTLKLSSRNLKRGKVFSSPPTPVPEEKEPTSSPAHPLEGAANAHSSPTSPVEKSAKISKAVRQPSIRRAAMVHSGTAAHIRSRSPSGASVDVNGLPTKPPFPVPTRSSSRKHPQSKSEGSQSPTPRSRGPSAGRRVPGTRHHQHVDPLRKIRSAAVMSRPAHTRSRSPSLPTSPSIPPSPSIDVGSQHRYGHQHRLSTTTSHTRQTGSGSIGSSAYHNNIVDAIAATMIGEWMWKYVRGKKVFGGQEPSTEFALAGEDGAATNGVRHKRWVWISPYERSVLWSSKQPSTGTALMGAKDRKLIIQSVLDIADNTPRPRGAGAEDVFDRSILILTPARALKFTTTTRERHYTWLTALTFLAHSNSPMPDIGPAPSALPLQEAQAHPSTEATLRRLRVRDSVRLAKAKASPTSQSFQAPMQTMPESNTLLSEELFAESADPPAIPRGPVHSRKRSSTGPLVPRPTHHAAYRVFSHPANAPSIYSTGSSDMYSSRQPPSVPSSIYNPTSVISARTSEASNSARPFIDAMGTVRMEAFIEDSLGRDPSQRVAQSPWQSSRRAPRKRQGSQWSVNEANRTDGPYDEFLVDPFRGF